jgi:anthranilate/para-aminobenzoate synthase component II
MAIPHERFPTFGVQYHPESVLTPVGHDILRNFLNAR